MDKVIIRLKKVTGQVNGIIKMIEQKEDCEKIIIQFQAVQAALGGAFSEVLENTLQACLKGKNQVQMKKILQLLSKK